MKGLRLDLLPPDLFPVLPAYDKNPATSIVDIDKKLGHWKRHLTEHYGDRYSFIKNYNQLPTKAFQGFSFEDLCKLYFSSKYIMDNSVIELFEKNFKYEVFRKIESSMWRWGMNKGAWNEIVQVYNSIRNFHFVNDPDFEIRLDFSTHCNEFGYSKYTRIFIDGVFAFLVYYKKEHAMTIGFSVVAEKKLLLQQIQLAKRTGNRFLYKLPTNRLEFVIDLFRKNFPEHMVYVVDGRCLVEKTIADYKRGLCRTREIYESCLQEISLASNKSKRSLEKYLLERKRECIEYEAKISHLEQDKGRLIAFYNNSGRFAIGSKSFKCNGLVHHLTKETK